MKLGIDCINKYLDVFKGKRVGLITNPTGINSKFESSIDVLKESTNLVALYSPEHGVRGNIQAGEKTESYIDERTGLPVYSLYGKTRKPTEEMMNEVDVLAIDIQDAGSRFYTYIYTMAYAMMACKEYGKSFVVFDRPNPAGCLKYEGNILDITYRSFVGYYPIVQRHGMTMCELAKMFNEEFNIGSELTLVLMEDYKRNMYYEDTSLLWVMPSPNFPSPDTAIVYNATCIFEGTNISEGRGTTIPFEVVGAPFVNPDEYANNMNKLGLNSVYFRPMYFTPTFSKHAGVMCGGVQVHVLDRDKFDAVKTGWAMLDCLRKLYPLDFKVNKPYVDGRPCMLEFNTGCDYIINNSKSLDEQFKIIEDDTKKFGLIREKYLLY